MKLTSILAIYVLFWVMSVFLVLPFGVKTADEAGIAKVPGQAESAPASFSFSRVAARATIVATVLFALFYVNYTQQWITVDMLDVTKWF